MRWKWLQSLHHLFQVRYKASTVVETFPDSSQSKIYSELINNIMNNQEFSTPTPMGIEEFEEFFYSYV